jgi:heptosyltransferase-1
MPIDTSSPTVLAIRLRQLGDVLSTLGSLRALKRVAPDHRIVFVVAQPYHALLHRVEFVDMLLAEPPRIAGLAGLAAYERYIENLRRLRPSRALDFHSSTRSAVLTFLSGAPVRVGFDVRVRKVLYTDVEPRAVLRDGSPVPRTSHEAALALVRRGGYAGARGDAGGTLPVTHREREEGRSRLERAGIPPAALEQGLLVGLNPGNPYPSKAWRANDFGRLARMLHDHGKTVVVLWGPHELETAGRVAEASGGAARIAPALSLDELPGVLRNFSVIVTIDSGLKHLAVAVGTPTVTLFGPTSPYEWHIGGQHDRFLYAGAPCSPCRLRECPYDTPCMTLITPEDAWRGVLEIERESATGRA